MGLLGPFYPLVGRQRIELFRFIRQFRKGPSRKLVFGNPHTLAIGPGQRAVFTSRSTRQPPQHLVVVHLYSEALGLLVFSASKVGGIRGSRTLLPDWHPPPTHIIRRSSPALLFFIV